MQREILVTSVLEELKSMHLTRYSIYNQKTEKLLLILSHYDMYFPPLNIQIRMTDLGQLHFFICVCLTERFSSPLQFKYAKISSKENGSVKKGVIFATYSSLIGESQSSGKYKTRFKQLLKWCGKDFDGVVSFFLLPTMKWLWHVM